MLWAADATETHLLSLRILSRIPEFSVVSAGWFPRPPQKRKHMTAFFGRHGCDAQDDNASSMPRSSTAIHYIFCPSAAERANTLRRIVIELSATVSPVLRTRGDLDTAATGILGGRGEDCAAGPGLAVAAALTAPTWRETKDGCPTNALRAMFSKASSLA